MTETSQKQWENEVKTFITLAPINMVKKPVDCLLQGNELVKTGVTLFRSTEDEEDAGRILGQLGSIGLPKEFIKSLVEEKFMPPARRDNGENIDHPFARLYLRDDSHLWGITMRIGILRKNTRVHTWRFTFRVPKGTPVKAERGKLTFEGIDGVYVTKLDGRLFLSFFGDFQEVLLPRGGSRPYPLSML